MKVLLLILAVVFSGCVNRSEFCNKPPSLHPVLSCEDCTWKEL